MSGVLITGGTTPLGRALVQALLDDGERTLVVAAAEPRPPDLPSRVVYERVDLTRSRDLRNLLFGTVRRLGLDTVVHAAHHRSARHRGAKARALDVESTRELLRLAERHPTLRRFVFRSSGDVYHVDPGRSALMTEQQPLDLSAGAPERVRDRVEADLTVCTRMGLSPLGIVVLRCAEIFAPDVGSQLYDYLSSPVCLRPLGFNPMVDLLTIEDAVRALVLAVDSSVQGVLNIPGADLLPLSEVIALSGRAGVALPGLLLRPLYRLRASAQGWEFRYDMNYRRFHFSAVLDGRRARAVLGYAPAHAIDWPSDPRSARANANGKGGGNGMPVRRGTARDEPDGAARHVEIH